jgi:hypothetical protein
MSDVGIRKEVGLNDFGETLFRFDGPAIGLK